MMEDWVWHTCTVPEPDVGGGALSYVSVFVHVYCCLDTQLVHIGIQQ